MKYQVGGSLPVDAPSYVVRKADTDLSKALRASEFCYVLNSRQMGKSSLQVQTMHKLQTEGIACAVIILTEIGSNHIITVDQWYAGVARILVRSFALGGRFDLRSWWRDRDHLSPVQRLSEFIAEVLLVEVSQNIVIFIDEIDSVLSLNFSTDDFFALIRNCYNQRADQPKYRRITFTLLGVATPSDLIRDSNRTPFNIGRAIELNGFQLNEAKPLAQGLEGKVSNPQGLLQEILNWTGGQPFLTHKLCQLIPDGMNVAQVGELVRSRIIENWESQDQQEHLRTISDRILRNEHKAGRLLGLYQQILQETEVAADDSPTQGELCLSGLVLKQHGKLRVYNRIYESVFDESWVNAALARLRPYAEAIEAWLDSNCQDESRLLRGQALQEALEWANPRSLSNKDNQFLTASQQAEQREVEVALAAEIEAKQILAQAQRKAKQTIKKGIYVLFVIAVAAIFVVTAAIISVNQAQQKLTQTQTATKLEKVGALALLQFETAPLEALVSAMKSGQDLKNLVTSRPLEEYPAVSPTLALQTILDNIRQENQIDTRQDGINSVRFIDTKNDMLIATGGEDGTVKLMNSKGQEPLKFQAHEQRILSIDVNQDAKKLATGSTNGSLKVWDISDHKSAHKLAEFLTGQGSVNNVRFIGDDEIATSGEDGTVRFWDLSTKEEKLKKIKAHERCNKNVPTPAIECDIYQPTIKSLNFSPIRNQIATAGDDGLAKLWQLDGRLVATLAGHKGRVNSIAFSPDGEIIATSGDDGTIKLWNSTGQKLREFTANSEGVETVRFSQNNGEILAAANKNGTVNLWNTQGKLLAEFKGHQGSVVSIRFSPKGRSNILATAGRDDATVRLWNLDEKPLLKFKGHRGKIRSVRFNQDGTRIVTASDDGTVRLWDTKERKHLKIFQDGKGKVQSVRFSPTDDNLIATAGDDEFIRLWKLNKKPPEPKKFKSRQDSIATVNFSNDGTMLATGGEDGTVKLWDLNGNRLKTFDNPTKVEAVRFSRDDKFLAVVGGGGMARLWNIQEEKKCVELKGHQGSVYGVSFRPDGQQVATAGDDGTIRQWNLLGQQLGEPIKTYQGSVTNISFSNDGQLLATVGFGGTVKLRTASGEQLANFKGHQGIVRSVSFSNDRKWLVTAGGDNIAILWPVRGLDELLNQGCKWLKDYFDTYPQDKLNVCQNK
ncbi:MAG: AAA-like domain-containing protein [Nostoc sp. ChiQUE02]|uniref:WD40 domain-containing protein n=1 Tax=Nostoc sp. ChiQUE02 TaxID=3075377 RepID=UPI002AD4B84F|nr:AAA-like domain-containing protein [Nostoc sp. ChiQUE02]MDZ8235220.1 AAA-like domain-containing protein [Nostoc sp. ChiQUE02]